MTILDRSFVLSELDLGLIIKTFNIETLHVYVNLWTHLAIEPSTKFNMRSAIAIVNWYIVHE